MQFKGGFGRQKELSDHQQQMIIVCEMVSLSYKLKHSTYVEIWVIVAILILLFIDREKLENDSYKACRVELTKMITTAEVREDVLDKILKLPDSKGSQVELFQVVRDYLLKDIQSVCPVEMLRPLRNHKEVKSLFKSVSGEVCKEVKAVKSMCWIISDEATIQIYFFEKGSQMFWALTLVLYAFYSNLTMLSYKSV